MIILIIIILPIYASRNKNPILRAKVKFWKLRSFSRKKLSCLLHDTQFQTDKLCRLYAFRLLPHVIHGEGDDDLVIFFALAKVTSIRPF